MRIELPPSHEEEIISIEVPDDGDAIVSRTGRRARVREDDDGRYVGLGVNDAERVMNRLENEFGVNYDREAGEIVPSTDSSTGTTDETDKSEASDDGDSNPMEELENEIDYERRRAEAEAFAEDHWNATKTAVLDGEADTCLDELKKADDRPTVQDAIEERREELEGAE